MKCTALVTRDGFLLCGAPDLAEGSAGRVVNAHGDAILVWLPEVAWEILCTDALANGHFSFTINYSKCHVSTSE